MIADLWRNFLGWTVSWSWSRIENFEQSDLTLIYGYSLLSGEASRLRISVFLHCSRYMNNKLFRLKRVVVFRRKQKGPTSLNNESREQSSLCSTGTCVRNQEKTLENGMKSIRMNPPLTRDILSNMEEGAMNNNSPSFNLQVSRLCWADTSRNFKAVRQCSGRN